MTPHSELRTPNSILFSIYRALYRHFGPQHWWPARTPFEVAVGAILTQNTAWANVEKAILNLKKNRLLCPGRVARLERSALERLIRPAGFFRVKARRLQEFARFIQEKSSGRIESLRSVSTSRLRQALLSVEGVGPETADSILLYALGKPSFVVDAYTRRVLLRHGLIGSASGKGSYDGIKRMFEENLPRRVSLFNEYHALLVAVGKNYCRPLKRCRLCPLNREAFFIRGACRRRSRKKVTIGTSEISECERMKFSK